MVLKHSQNMRGDKNDASPHTLLTVGSSPEPALPPIGGTGLYTRHASLGEGQSPPLKEQKKVSEFSALAPRQPKGGASEFLDA